MSRFFPYGTPSVIDTMKSHVKNLEEAAAEAERMAEEKGKEAQGLYADAREFKASADSFRAALRKLGG